MDLTESWRKVLPQSIVKRYDVREVRDAAAVLQSTSPVEFAEMVAVLEAFTLGPNDFLVPGGSKGDVAIRLDEAFRKTGWREGRYDTTITATLTKMPYRAVGEKQSVVTKTEVLNLGYKTDNVKGKVALDVEWNAKDGNLDRDIGAFRALYDAGAISAGVIFTRTQDDLRALGATLGRDPFATTTTTNLVKLLPRMTRGDAGGCPILAVAATARCFEP